MVREAGEGRARDRWLRWDLRRGRSCRTAVRARGGPVTKSLVPVPANSVRPNRRAGRWLEEEAGVSRFSLRWHDPDQVRTVGGSAPPSQPIGAPDGRSVHLRPHCQTGTFVLSKSQFDLQVWSWPGNDGLEQFPANRPNDWAL